MTPQLPLSTDELDKMYEAMPRAFEVDKRANVTDLVTGRGELTASDISRLREQEASSNTLGVTTPSIDLKAVRASHHRIAQLLAAGMSDADVARATNYGTARIAVLRQSPAVVNLISHYISSAEDAFPNFTEVAVQLKLDMLHLLQERIDETPEKFQVGHLIEGIKALADRTGHAPVNKSVNLNVAADMGDRMLAIRERLRKVNT